MITGISSINSAGTSCTNKIFDKRGLIFAVED
jgi:hypothetical protein